MMKVEILQEFKHGVDTYFVGEQVFVEEALADYWCRAGWVKDLAGNLVTATPEKDALILEVQDINQNVVLENING